MVSTVIQSFSVGGSECWIMSTEGTIQQTCGDRLRQRNPEKGHTLFDAHSGCANAVSGKDGV